MPGHSELAFETASEAYLTRAGGYQKRDASAYDEALTLFTDDVTGFLQDSQPARWAQLEALLGRTVLEAWPRSWRSRAACLCCAMALNVMARPF